MIYCNLKGGLGNMLFQIAAVKSFSIDKGVECSFPNLNNQLSLINTDNYYNPSIKHSFEYKDMLQNVDDSSPVPGTRYPIFNYPFEYVSFNLPADNFFVDGFFQSEKYFVHNRKEILDFLNITPDIAAVIESKYANLLEARTTSIHVRRGDYLLFPKLHPVQTLEYYDKGVELLKEKTDTFVIFSDDIPWCKENLKYSNVVYIENERDYIELYLMSMCDNNITCNSSFSWWGAWLNRNENKTVIGPEKWFGPEKFGLSSNDILPESWIKF